ncbi:hypothetical protein ACHHYP_11007 [Achlya hypogyna]|uniref:Uncharacterized protein n=1 Tax=Achlya hypogyna TaxID=1202772 RepID=A0A1V9ZHM3_ACHHY|nr:hypothetical protein ACHHYP_11007 [Achlya hypogyna]
MAFAEMPATHRRSVVCVMDIQSDWSEHDEDETFWVSTMERSIVYDTPPSDAVMTSSSTSPPTPVFKDPVRTEGGPFHVASRTPTRMTIMGEDAASAITFLSPTADVEYDSQLFCVGASPDGKFLGLGGAHGAFHAVHVPTAQRVSLQGHVGDVTSIAFYPSSLVALTGAADFRLRIWSLQSFKCAAVLEGHVGTVTGTGILGRGRNIVSCASDAKVMLWNCGTSERLAVWTLASPSTCMVVATDAPSPGGDLPVHPLESETDGKVIFAGTEGHGLQGIDVRADEPVLALPAATVTSCAMYPARAHTVLVGSSNGTLSTYDLRRPTVPLTMVSRSNAAVTGLYSTPDGEVWAASGDGSCSKWAHLDTSPMVDTEALGPTYDALNGIVGVGNNLYTVSRDRHLRTYAMD